MAAKGKLEELRQAVLGNGRGREVEVNPDGQVVLNQESDPGNPSDQGNGNPKTPKMSPHTWATI